MSFITPIILAVLAGSGVLFGILLSFLAPDERLRGGKYLAFLKTVLFLATIVVLGIALLQQQGAVLVSVALIPVAFFLLGQAKKETLWKIMFTNATVLSMGAALFLLDGSWQLFVASLLFLYGLPAGTLLRPIPQP
ncbi:MAG TPA: hypothetical protein VJC21_04945 [Candidatus Nanoarchaeia archaeon]|nr:hypothetical protein [Candidatus Nanoarchaeia archaeon]